MNNPQSIKLKLFPIELTDYCYEKQYRYLDIGNKKYALEWQRWSEREPKLTGIVCLMVILVCNWGLPYVPAQLYVAIPPLGLCMSTLKLSSYGLGTRWILFLFITLTVDSFLKITFQVFREVWPTYTSLLVNHKWFCEIGQFTICAFQSNFVDKNTSVIKMQTLTTYGCWIAIWAWLHV